MMMADLRPPTGFRGALPPGHVFFGWDITYQCNFQCSYCTLGDDASKAGKPVTRVLSPERWRGIWAGIGERYGSCHIHVSGGEPFHYPAFMGVLAGIAEMHTFECSTNFFWDPREFVNLIPADRARIGISFHPEHADFSDFLARARVLTKAGFEVWANHVAFPPYLSDLADRRKACADAGIAMSILPFLGMFEGRRFPAEYAENERVILRALGTTPWETKNLAHALEAGDQAPRRRLCRMGQMYAKIHADGQAFACCAQEAVPLGNIIDGSFTLRAEPVDCRAPACPCWKCMECGREDHWVSHWVAPPALRRARDGSAAAARPERIP